MTDLIETWRRRSLGGSQFVHKRDPPVAFITIVVVADAVAIIDLSSL